MEAYGSRFWNFVQAAFNGYTYTMHIYVYMYTYTYIYIYTHVFMFLSLSVCMYVCMRAYLAVSMVCSWR